MEIRLRAPSWHPSHLYAWELMAGDFLQGIYHRDAAGSLCVQVFWGIVEAKSSIVFYGKSYSITVMLIECWFQHLCSVAQGSDEKTYSSVTVAVFAVTRRHLSYVREVTHETPIVNDCNWVWAPKWKMLKGLKLQSWSKLCASHTYITFLPSPDCGTGAGRGPRNLVFSCLNRGVLLGNSQWRHKMPLQGLGTVSRAGVLFDV